MHESPKDTLQNEIAAVDAETLKARRSMKASSERQRASIHFILNYLQLTGGGHLIFNLSPTTLQTEFPPR